jgi:hypothetical protein
VHVDLKVNPAECILIQRHAYHQTSTIRAIEHIPAFSRVTGCVFTTGFEETTLVVSSCLRAEVGHIGKPITAIDVAGVSGAVWSEGWMHSSGALSIVREVMIEECYHFAATSPQTDFAIHVHVLIGHL